MATLKQGCRRNKALKNGGYGGATGRHSVVPCSASSHAAKALLSAASHLRPGVLQLGSKLLLRLLCLLQGLCRRGLCSISRGRRRCKPLVFFGQLPQPCLLLCQLLLQEGAVGPLIVQSAVQLVHALQKLTNLLAQRLCLSATGTTAACARCCKHRQRCHRLRWLPGSMLRSCVSLAAATISLWAPWQPVRQLRDWLILRQLWGRGRNGWRPGRQVGRALCCCCRG